MKKPPKKLSRLIRLALADLAKVERSKKYVVDMTWSWHSPQPSGKCAVCLAGSVMAKTLNVPPDRFANPRYYDFSDEWLDALLMLNDVRQGCLSLDLNEKGIPDRRITPYRVKKTQWRKDMWKIVRELEAKGL